MPKKRKVTIADTTEELRDDYCELFDSMERRVIGHSSALHKVKLALLIKEHVMLSGKHGLAKSFLASEVFASFRGACFYKKQLSKSTQAEELFGPLNLKKYQEEAIWENNTKGMLPTAHFVFLDEVYRAADMLLPTLLGILNEREVINGGIKYICPLQTAIGTTNFITTQNAQLDAFHDRWLFWDEMSPLGRTDKISMLIRQTDQTSARKHTMAYADLVILQEKVAALPIEEETLTLLVEMSEMFASKDPDTYISDRRLCQIVKGIKAIAFLEGASIASPEHLVVFSKMLPYSTTQRSKLDMLAGTTYSTLVGSYITEREENTKLSAFEQEVLSIYRRCDSSLSSSAKQLLMEVSQELRDEILSFNAVTPNGMNKRGHMLNRLIDILAMCGAVSPAVPAIPAS